MSAIIFPSRRRETILAPGYQELKWNLNSSTEEFTPFRNLKRFDEDLLFRGTDRLGTLESGSTYIVLPLAGQLSWTSPGMNEELEPGMGLKISPRRELKFSLKTGGEAEWCNFLMIELAQPASPAFEPVLVFTFGPDAMDNRLVDILKMVL